MKKINSLLRKRYKLISSDFISVKRDGIFVSLQKGVTSTLVYENSKTKETFKVCYNSIKSSKADSRNLGSKTITQKPDNLLAINKIGSGKAYEFVFDAKYKIETSKEYVKNYGGIGPKEENIKKELKLSLLEALAELESNECHKNREFPKTRLHRVTGYSKYVYRADIDKVSGWRIHLQYNKLDNSIVLKDIIEGQKHDNVIEIIKSKKNRYE